MNRRMNIPQFSKIMMEFSMESEALDMKEDMMSEAIDDAMASEEDEEEEEKVVQAVFDEIGIKLDQDVSFTVLGCVS